jgi:16S rRNA (adenine1518-N6/adenine1519-N6)-dimethyltransferase
VKTAFNQRRKTLSNSLKSILPADFDKSLPVFKQRPEQLSVEEFVALANLILPD